MVWSFTFSTKKYSIAWYVCVLSNVTDLLSSPLCFSTTSLLTPLCLPPDDHTTAAVAHSLLKKPWTESGSTQQQKEAIGTILKYVL